jgi:transposase InsO family protein
LSLWVAERVAERRLLQEDGIEMSEDTWLELVLAFVTSEERQTLRVPARDQRARNGEHEGYDITQLQEALAVCDSENFKRFRQTNCTDPVAARVLSIDRLLVGSSEKAKKGNKPESHSLELPEANALQKPPLAGVAKPSTKVPTLPQKAGQPDTEVYAKFAVGSLRRRVWDAIAAKKCPRCQGDHLRVSCPKARQPWEDDFEKADFFTKKFAKKQVRVQLSSNLRTPNTEILSVSTPLGMCLVDSCSDITIARRDVLRDLARVDAPIVVAHLGGDTILREAGTLHLGVSGVDANIVTLHEVLAVGALDLPDGIVALIGVADVRRLGLSLDAILARPGCRLTDALAAGPFAGPMAGQAEEVDQQSSSSELPPALDRGVLLELQARARAEQEERTVERIGCLFIESPPSVKKVPVKQESSGHASARQQGTSHRAAPAATSTSPSSPKARRGEKFYAVRVGRSTGIFLTWGECQDSVNGYRAAEFKSFKTRREAEAYLGVTQAKRCYVGWRVAREETAPARPASFVAGRALRATVKILQEGETRPILVQSCLDSGSDVNLANRIMLHDVHPILREAIANCGDQTEFSEEGTLWVFTSGSARCIPALVATTAQLPFGCDVLLGIPGVDDLGVKLDSHRGKTPRALECHVGEKTLRAWLDANGAKDVSKVSFDVAEVDICPAIPEAMTKKVRALLAEYSEVFAGQQNSLPKPFVAEPVELKFVANPEPHSIPEPRWTFAQKQVLTAWAEEGLSNGSLELSTSRWASRPHIVMKTPAAAHKDLVNIGKCKIRVCGDYRMVNQQIVKIVPNLPNGLEEVERAAGHRFYWETDAVACYSQFVLAPGRSREALAVWSPIGLVQPTTLPFGQRNSGTEAQGPYRAAANEMNVGRHGNYVDDWIGYSNDLEQLFADFRAFLQVCLKYQITLGPPKTRFGYPEAQFFGFRVNEQGSHLAVKHLDPLRSLVPPVDVHELRRVLGLFVVSRKYIKDYAVITKPMTDLLKGKAVTFQWGQPQQAAFDFVRDRLLAGVHLSAPNFELPFHLATDASEDGKGGLLYQLPSVPIVDQHPYCPKLHSPDLQAVIFFLSKAHTATHRLKPPFYIEGDALLWATLKCKYYALSSPFPLYTYSDHMPLNWMQKTEKGPISSFIIEQLSEIETVHQYIQGKMNGIPDSCSRFPMLGPKQLAARGFAHCVEEVLKRLPVTLKTAKVVHFHGGRNNAELRACLKLWFEHVSALVPLNPPRGETPSHANVAILAPRCEVAPVILATYLLSTVPFALLIPVDLLDMARKPDIFPRAPYNDIAKRFEQAGKLTILEAQMTWVVGNLPECRPIETFALRLRTPAPLTSSNAIEPEEDVEGTVPRTLEAWVRAQQGSDDFPATLDLIDMAAIRQELWIHAPPESSPTIIVPTAYRETLTRDVHSRMFHLGSAKVFAMLKQSYFWPTMKTDVRKILADCPECELNKARQQTAHGLFSAMPVQAPRARWCMDFQGQGHSLTGETEALALIDPTSRYVVVIPLKDREATTWIQPFLDRIVFTFGAPEVLHSDAAPEFLSAALDLLAKATGIRTTTTMGHNARGNGTIEVFWRFWNRCLRLLPDDHYVRWPAIASSICFAFNTASQDAIAGVTPFQVYHGAPARDNFASLLLDHPLVDEDKEVILPKEFAEAVTASTKIFIQLAKTHDDFVRAETAARLNEKGTSRTFSIGDKVKIRVPPTVQQMEATGRRAKHITAWRGPCTVTERLSATSYAVTHDDTKRAYERVITNMLPYRAKRAKIEANARFNELYSSPFEEGEFIAIRDDPGGPIYVAEVMDVRTATVILHYYGTTGIVLATAIFLPCWHKVTGTDILLNWDCPEFDNHGMLNFTPYSGEVDLESIPDVLVARNLQFTKHGKLRFRSLRALTPVHDQIFRFER